MTFERLLRPGLVGRGTLLPHWLDGDRFWYVDVDGGTYLVDAEARTRVPYSPPPADDAPPPAFIRKPLLAGFPPVFELPSPDGRRLATERDADIWLRDPSGGEDRRLTRDGRPDWPWDLEGGRWSPDGRLLAVQRVDRRHVVKRPLVHWLEVDEQVEWIRHTKAGGELEHARLHLLDVEHGTAVEVDHGPDPESRLHPIGWRGGELLAHRSNRVLNPVELVAVDPSGRLRVIVEERSPTFISFGDYLTRFTRLPGDETFLWRSERDGWSHLYHYDFAGQLLAQVTRGQFPVLAVAGVDQTEGWVYYLAHGERRLYDTHLYRSRLDGSSEPQRLSEPSGQRHVFCAPGADWYVDNHSHLDRAPRAELRRADGELVLDLGEADASDLAAAYCEPPEEFIALAADGSTEIHGVLFKPPGFDSAGSYPVIEHIYAGPQRCIAPRAFDDPRAVLPRAFASLGYVCVTLDARGTPERSKAFHDVVHRRFGSHEIADHAGALRQLATTRPYLDLERVGIFGHSWGGYFAIRGMLQEPALYRAGVALAPAVDLYDHLAQAIEPFMGTPESNRDGYERASNLKLVSNLTGRLLLVHGSSDANATFSASMKLAAALQAAGKPYELVVLPDVDHLPEGDALVYVMHAARRHFAAHLLGVIED